MALSTAEPGDELVYHIGKYAAGAHKRDALAAQKGGFCLLYQKRIEDGVFAYIARKPKGKDDAP